MWPGVGLENVIAIVALGLVSLAFQVFLVAFGVVIAWHWLHRPGGPGSKPRSGAKNAFEILEERYACGEIDARDFEERWERIRQRYEATS